MRDVLQEIEAIIFSSSKGITVEEISKRLKIPEELVKLNIKKLMKKYDEEGSSIELTAEGDLYKLKVKSKYANLLSGKNELGRGLLMTLSAIAIYSPLQLKDLVSIRGSVARQHVSQLVKLGLVSKKKEGNNVIVRLADHFFEYFDISRNDLEEIRAQFKQ
ncbi:MAG: SMC-Scp complex subunit ScpB [Conexivisphaerales archaeon]